MSYTIVLLFAGIIIIGALMFAFIGKMTRGKRKKHLNIEQYRVKCLAIENQLKRDNPSSYHLSVLNADKLVDQALKESGVNGETMGDRLKNSISLISDQNGIWTAHKLRNRIAHDTDVSVSYDEACYALSCFRKALKDLGAI